MYFFSAWRIGNIYDDISSGSNGILEEGFADQDIEMNESPFIENSNFSADAVRLSHSPMSLAVPNPNHLYDESLDESLEAPWSPESMEVDDSQQRHEDSPFLDETIDETMEEINTADENKAECSANYDISSDLNYFREKYLQYIKDKPWFED